MTKKAQAGDYKRSVWSGVAYDRSQTQDELTAESKRVISNHSAIGRAMSCDDDMMRRLFGAAFDNRV